MTNYYNKAKKYNSNYNTYYSSKNHKNTSYEVPSIDPVVALVGLGSAILGGIIGYFYASTESEIKYQENVLIPRIDELELEAIRLQEVIKRKTIISNSEKNSLSSWFNNSNQIFNESKNSFELTNSSEDVAPEILRQVLEVVLNKNDDFEKKQLHLEIKNIGKDIGRLKKELKNENLTFNERKELKKAKNILYEKLDAKKLELNNLSSPQPI
ncbi:MAG: hypothetical protein U0457_12780 [Candidatus Sericytochromatia bacterium]